MAASGYRDPSGERGAREDFRAHRLRSQERNHLATLSVGLGVLGVFPFSLLCSIPAIIVARAARQAIKYGVADNVRMATLGTVLGYIGTIGWSVSFGLMIALALSGATDGSFSMMSLG